MLLLGTRKGLVTFDHDGSDWQFISEAFKAIPISYAAADPRNGTLWALLDMGHWGPKLHRSRDNGATWQEVETPKYPEGATRKDDVPAVLTYLWYMMPGGADQPERVYLGAEPGGLFQSDDGGDSFHLVETFWNQPERKEWWMGGGRDESGVCSIVVDPRDSRHVTVGISVGGVYETCDGGETWQARNKGLQACYFPDPNSEFGHDPHFMLAAPSNPDILWQQNHCGVFRSTDGAQNWTEVSAPPVYFGFAIEVDENDPDVAWVVPAIDAEYRMAVDRSLCVCRTDDGGKTWKECRSGLPQSTTYDLTFRHALDKQGDTLVFGTTTGNVYVSDDRGDHWRCIANNLPPIYSVRFA
ncbi:MAG: glycosyl hydrolase [Chloroflexota bacterium]